MKMKNKLMHSRARERNEVSWEEYHNTKRKEERRREQRTAEGKNR